MIYIIYIPKLFLSLSLYIYIFLYIWGGIYKEDKIVITIWNDILYFSIILH